MKQYTSIFTLASILILLTIFIPFTGCKKYVSIPPPETQLVSASVFSSNSTANAAQLNVYTQMTTEGFMVDLDIYLGLSADELINYSTSVDQIQLYKNALVATNADVPGIWNTAYNFIYQENSILEGLSGSTGVTSQVKSQLTGEAEFGRAFMYFYLVNLFGDVPLITTTNYTNNGVATRTPDSLVYSQIVRDLTDATQKLSPNYVGGDGVTTTPEKLRPNQSAAMAMLARTYLYTEKWDSAEMASTAVINGAYTLCQSLDSVFLVNNPEAIWQLSNGPYNTFESLNFILTSTPQNIALSPILYGAFEPGDNRLTDWIGTLVSAGQTYYFPYKYQVSMFATPIVEYCTALRLAEQYLIRAEARAQRNDLADAIKDLDTIRYRAGLPDYAGATDQTSVLAAILHERQVELFTEEGQRWLDLKRTAQVNTVMSTVTPEKGGITWDAQQALYPIPQNDRNADPNLGQNPAY